MTLLFCTDYLLKITQGGRTMVHIGKHLKNLTLTASLCVLASAPFHAAMAAEEAKKAEAKTEKKADKPAALDGKAISFDTKKGNCLACHMIPGGDAAGNIAPPLMSMKARFPDKAALRAQISDPTVKNPVSFMPPFGKHKILSEKEIDAVTDFIYSL